MSQKILETKLSDLLTEYNTGTTQQAGLRDLLTDLLHICYKRGINLVEALDDAKELALEEIEEELEREERSVIVEYGDGTIEFDKEDGTIRVFDKADNVLNKWEIDDEEYDKYKEEYFSDEDLPEEDEDLPDAPEDLDESDLLDDEKVINIFDEDKNENKTGFESF